MKLSIITINFNNAEGLRKTIDSVVSQTFTDFEYIIIDGGSTDGSVDIIKQYANAPLSCGERLGERLYWVSEPDKGIYNAMNKGILQAKGEYCLFLNSGDWLVDNEVFADFIKMNFMEDIIVGNMLMGKDDVYILKKSPNEEELDFDYLYNSFIPHESSFIRKKLFDSYGLYNESYRIASDWEFFFLTLILHQAVYRHFDRNIIFFDNFGISSTGQGRIERKITYQKYIPLIYKSYLKLNERLQFYENSHREYMHLKNGKLGIFLKLLLKIKRYAHKIKNKTKYDKKNN